MTSLLSAIRTVSSSAFIKNLCQKNASNQLMDQTSSNVNQFLKSYWHWQRNFSAMSRSSSANISAKPINTQLLKNDSLRLKIPKISPSKEKEPLTFEGYKKKHLMTYEEFKRDALEYNDKYCKPAIFYEESAIQEDYQYYCKSSYYGYLETLDPSKQCNPCIL